MGSERLRPGLVTMEIGKKAAADTGYRSAARSLYHSDHHLAKSG